MFSVQLVGRGDERIRATHTKTLELIAGTELTERATCVIAVETVSPHQRMAGPVRVTISAAEETFAFDARANSAWDTAATAVLRRGPLRLPGTLATHAAVGAADLPRPLVERLRDPASVVTVTLEPRESEPCLVIFAVDPTVVDDPRLAAEIAAADRVVATDATSARLVPAGSLPDDVSGRTLVLTTDPTSDLGIAADGVPVETVGMPPALAAAAAAPWTGPIAFAADAAQALRRTPAGYRLVVPTDRRGLAALLRQAGEIRGSTRAVVTRDYADPVLVSVNDPGDFPGADRLFVCPGPGHGEIGPAVWSAVDGLLADGVPTRATARALSAVTGWPQRRAYDAVLARRADRPTLDR